MTNLGGMSVAKYLGSKLMAWFGPIVAWLHQALTGCLHMQFAPSKHPICHPSSSAKSTPTRPHSFKSDIGLHPPSDGLDQ